jgi:uncharacterized protein DUF4440/uncharacterized protein DUF3471
MKRFVAMCLAGAVVLGVASCKTGNAGVITQEELVRRTQELFDAVAPGDQRPWKKYVASDAMYFDEKGRNMDKATLVNDVAPLPAGYSGMIRLVNPQSRIIGDTAILSYDLDETEIVFGQSLKARYHETDTWMRRNGEWQIVAGQVLRYYEDPAPGKPDLAKYRDYAGVYELAPGTAMTIVIDGNDLYAQRTGKPRELLVPEAPDIFFRKGVEGRRLFRRADGGHVDALIDRRNNEDIIWKRVK